MKLIFRIIVLLLSLSAVKAEWVKYEAEKAHVSGNAFKTLSNGDYVTLLPVDPQTYGRLIFSVFVASDNYYPIRFAVASRDTAALSVQTNGIFQKHVLLPKSHSWAVHEESVWLRTGLNSLVLQAEKLNSNLGIDYIEIYGAKIADSRGATLPYYVIEAEDAETNGVLIGPNRTYMTLPSEASGRLAIQLNSSSEYVEFTLSSPANGVVIRYSIPDSANGYGLYALLGLSVNSQQVTVLNITSRYSWIYGIYPFTNNPSDGLPHHFYDDTSFLFNETLPAGTKLRLVPLTDGLVYTIDLVDLYEVPPPYNNTNKYTSVIDYGADPTGQADSTKAFQAALNVSQGGGIWIPEGKFLVRSVFTLNNTIVRGAGPWYTEVFTDIPQMVGFYGLMLVSSVNVGIYDLAITGATIQRNDSLHDYGIGGTLSNSIIQNLWIQHTKCGMWLGSNEPYKDLYISGIIVRNTFADGINFYRGATNCMVEQSSIRNSGDDCLALFGWYFQDSFTTIQFNTVQLPMLANGIAIYGGLNNSATDNLVYDIVVEGGALQVGNRYFATPLSGTTLFERNTAYRGGAWDRAHAMRYGSLVFWAQNAHMNSTVIVDDLEVVDSAYSGISFVPSVITNVSITNAVVNGVTMSVMEVFYGCQGEVYIANLTAINIPSGGQTVLRHACTPPFTIVQGPNNEGWNDTTCSLPSITPRNIIPIV